MRKMIWEATSPNKARCEICKGGFGLIRYQIAQKTVLLKTMPRALPSRESRAGLKFQSFKGRRSSLALGCVSGPNLSRAGLGSLRAKLSKSQPFGRSETSQGPRPLPRMVPFGRPHFSSIPHPPSYFIRARLSPSVLYLDSVTSSRCSGPLHFTLGAVSLSRCSIIFGGALLRSIARSSLCEVAFVEDGGDG
jgi:hypothetical protein